MWKSKFYGAFVLNHRVLLHAIDATPARWRGDAGSSPLDRARTAASSPRNDLVKNCRAHPTHWLISTQVSVPFREAALREFPERSRPRPPAATAFCNRIGTNDGRISDAAWVLDGSRVRDAYDAVAKASGRNLHYAFKDGPKEKGGTGLCGNQIFTARCAGSSRRPPRHRRDARSTAEK